MKKILSLVLVLALAVTLPACATGNDPEQGASSAPSNIVSDFSPEADKEYEATVYVQYVGSDGFAGSGTFVDRVFVAYPDADQAAMILTALPSDKQADVAKRIAEMDRTSPDVIREVERVLERKLSSLVTQDFTTAGGVKAIVEILNRVDRTSEKAIIETLEVDNPELTEEIKKLMFVFEDIVMIDDRSIQRILRDVDNKDLSLSLKATPKEVADKVFKNMSTRAADMLREEIEFMGPVKIRDVEEAQQRIVNVIRNLEDKGEIVVARGKGEEMIV